MVGEPYLARSCDPPQRYEMSYQPSTLLDQFVEGMRARDLNIFGSTKPSPLLLRRQSDEIEKRNKMRAAQFLRRMFKGRKPPPSAPQSSMDDAATQLSETSVPTKATSVSKESENDTKTKLTKKTKTKESIDELTNVNKKKRTKRKQKTPKTQKEAPKSPNEDKKRWWHLW
ncbi:hypothetical protein ANCCAN_11677 [Ancylostoma caninum]|uniref:Uncharacterized protein n=1 Tax=Ancylostoma caninum TaxID=29170 RepID=A0A368GH59_ANCCA|nr:hypothetical protein ANCCAN_11677 [Ancylostoma caninum]